jgi:hypothetical protein
MAIGGLLAVLDKRYRLRTLKKKIITVNNEAIP